MKLFSKDHQPTSCLMVTYDTQNAFLYTLTLTVEKPRKSHKAYKTAVDLFLRDHGIFS